MANRNFANSRMYTGHVKPVLLDGRCSIDSSGDPSDLKGPYIKSVSHLGAGAYQIQAQDNYNGVFAAMAQCDVAPSGSNIDPALGTPGAAYIIKIIGDTDWSTAGVPAGVSPAVGLGFVLASAPSAGTGRVKAIQSSGIMSVEIVGDPNLSSAQILANSGSQGAIVLLQCFDKTGAPADPASGSVLRFQMYLSDSSVLIGGE